MKCEASIRVTQLSPGPKPLMFARHVLPGLAAVAGDLDLAVVRAHPDDALLERRLGDGQDGAVVLGAGVVGGQAAGVLELGRIVGRQVRAGLGPGLAPVEGPEEEVAAEIEDVPVVGREVDRRVPIETVGRLVERRFGPDADGFPRLEVVAFDAAHLQVAIEDPPIDGVELGVIAVAAAGRDPLGVVNTGRARGCSKARASSRCPEGRHRGNKGRACRGRRCRPRPRAGRRPRGRGARRPRRYLCRRRCLR